MMDVDTFDRCDGNEDAVEAAQKRHKKNLKNLLMVSALVRTLGNDWFDDMDWEDDSDEIYNC